MSGVADVSMTEEKKEKKDKKDKEKDKEDKVSLAPVAITLQKTLGLT